MKKEKRRVEDITIGATDNDLAAENICNDFDMTYADLQDLQKGDGELGKSVDG